LVDVTPGALTLNTSVAEEDEAKEQRLKKNRAVFQSNRDAGRSTAQEWEMKFKK